MARGIGDRLAHQLLHFVAEPAGNVDPAGRGQLRRDPPVRADIGQSDIEIGAQIAALRRLVAGNEDTAGADRRSRFTLGLRLRPYPVL